MSDMPERDLPLFRIIAPAYPRENIYTKIAEGMTALAPLTIGTIVNGLGKFRVKFTDENNYIGPRDQNGMPDHSVLQATNPAAVVGFYCGLTCTIERVWEIARFYRWLGILTIAGGWHAKDCIEETLEHGIDVVFYANESAAVEEFFSVFEGENHWKGVPGTAYMEHGQVVKNRFVSAPAVAGYDKSLDDSPFPDYGLLECANEIEIYTIRRIVGCSEGCEFCRVKAIPRWASPERLSENVKWLVEKFGARIFFIADDNSGEDREGGLKFFRMIEKKYGRKLKFYLQARVDIAKDTELVEAMWRAGVVGLCIGYESPIDEDLKAMGKGFVSADMVRWTRILFRTFRRIHGMFIIGYPSKEGELKVNLSPEQIVMRYKRFICKSGLTSIQVLLPTALVKTGLRKRMERDGKLLPLEVASWNHYDGTLAVTLPDNMSFEEFQELPEKIMSWFYSPWSYVRLVLKICTFLIDCPIRGWWRWRRSFVREAIRSFGSNLVKKWQERGEKESLIKRVKEYLKKKKEQ